ncbi:hypothetical protein FRC09_004174 [Ceratobasidium sp. 395]|nr:hypothetical protein FRC09_004174 [Ceratobasidium sp. 395]
MEELYRLREVASKVENMADELHACWLMVQENEQKIHRGEYYSNRLIAGHYAVDSIPSEFEKERLDLLFGKIPPGGVTSSPSKRGMREDRYVHHLTWSEVRDKQSGEVDQAKQVIDELYALRGRFKAWGDYAPLIRLSKNWKSPPSSPRRPASASPTESLDNKSTANELSDQTPADMSLDRSQVDESMDSIPDRPPSVQSHVSICDSSDMEDAVVINILGLDEHE